MPEVKALLLGDLVGSPGCRALFFALPLLREKYSPDIIVVNGENAQEGFGITPDTARALFAAGVDVITTGNHVWEEPSIFPYLEECPFLLRPQNYSRDLPGSGCCTVERGGVNIAVLNFQGRLQMPLTDDPFRMARETAESLKNDAPVILVDFHCEATEEKEAFAHHLDGLVSLVAGTHTHVPTNDLRILPKGTAAVTDLGMCGPWPSVIGSRLDDSLRRLKTQLPVKARTADGRGRVQGIFATIDGTTGKALHLERIEVVEE